MAVSLLPLLLPFCSCLLVFPLVEKWYVVKVKMKVKVELSVKTSC